MRPSGTSLFCSMNSTTSRSGCPEETALSEDQDLGVCVILSPIQEPKWKSWLNPA